jgi:hypothetical protein
MVTLQTILNTIVNSRHSVLTSSSYSGLRVRACDLAHQQHARVAVCSARTDSTLTADAHRVFSVHTRCWVCAIHDGGRVQQCSKCGRLRGLR